MKQHMRWKKGSRLLAAMVAGAVAASLSPSVAGANIIGSCGDVNLMDPLPDVRPHVSESDENLQIFQEATNRRLEASVTVDASRLGNYDNESLLPLPKPVIPAGTMVDSYFIHADPIGNNVGEGVRFRATLTFDSDILGVMALDDTLSASDAALGNPDTIYPTGVTARGLEMEARVEYFHIIDPRTVDLSIITSTVTDQVRVVTAASAMEHAGGYRLLASDGGVFTFGSHEFLGSTGDIQLNQPIVGGASTCTGNGYWMVASDGGIFSFGEAGFFGSTGDINLNQPIVAMAPTPSGNGYWLVASDGGIFAFGDASFRGSTGRINLNQPIVTMAPTPAGNGYWLVASDGGIFSFGEAGFFGSTGDINLNKPIVTMAPTPTGNGYWLVASDGGIFAFGNAGFFGSTGDINLNKPIVGML